MRLYLSSYRIPNLQALLELAGGQPEEHSVAIIPNAKDYYAERARSFKLKETSTYLSQRNLNNQVVDLRDYTNGEMLYTELSKYTMLWVTGGNTFCLRDAIQSSGFDTALLQLVNEGIVYAGESAGACIVGNSLRGLESADEPEFTKNILWEGLGLIDNFILPHADNKAFEHEIEYARKIHQNEATVIELNDSQALIVNGPDQHIIEAL